MNWICKQLQKMKLGNFMKIRGNKLFFVKKKFSQIIDKRLITFLHICLKKKTSLTEPQRSFILEVSN